MMAFAIICSVNVWEPFLEGLFWEGYSKNGSILNVFSQFLYDIVWFVVVLAKMLCARWAMRSCIHKFASEYLCF